MLAVAAVVLGGAVPAQARSSGSEVAARVQFAVTVSPHHGVAGSTFTATLTISPGPCDGLEVGFYLDGSVQPGRELAPLTTMSESCIASATVTVPQSWSSGTKRIYGTYGTLSVPPNERGASFTVPDPEPSPSPTPSPSVSSGRNASPSPTPTATATRTPGSTETTPASAVGTPSTGAPNSQPAGAHASVSDTPPTPAARTLADLQTSDAGHGISVFTWLGLGLVTIAGLIGAMVFRRRMAVAETEGKHRQAPGRWNASDY
jgi:hypothetical protein